ncbi:hypothetical protein AWJ20_3489 [Sugiyamaella lignohabitans]|uniref:Acetyl-CoA synthetase-like protein n=1 Tax=Sugiyamaella lignohabitans TaxID=796027 RepID=A0A167FXZ9_9ASCO|nr:uncharacterized protein AWJ20_3489 [Sugiyamaella lignohabitans]ANB15845.1 hypothetical protein AWJ20_3489 [Sugiyamaella lignohabitans]
MYEEDMENSIEATPEVIGDEGERPATTTYRSTATPAQQLGLITAELRGVKLQKPLEPREIPENGGSRSDPHNKSILMSKFDNLPSILRHRGKSISRFSAFTVLDAKGKEVSTISWDKLASRSEKVAQMIRDKSGLYRGDRVTLFYQENELIEFVVALLGCFVAGVVAVPVAASSRYRDIEYILTSTQSHLALTTEASHKLLQKTIALHKFHWPKNVEWWKTNEFGLYHPPSKKAELPPLQVPDLAYIEFSRSPLGELRGVVMSHRTILHQMTCLTAMLQSRDNYHGKKGATRVGGRTVLCNVDLRQSIGLIIGVLLTVYSGNSTVWVPQSALSVEGLYANAITRYRANILLSDYPSLKSVAVNYQNFPHATRNFSKKLPVDFSSVSWCLIDALTVDPEFYDLLADRWLKPLGNSRAREVVTPMLTLSEHGGMVISMRDWLEGQDKMGCNLGGGNAGINSMVDDDINSGPFDLSEVYLDNESLSSNVIKIVSSSYRSSTGQDPPPKLIRVGAFGYPLPDATLAIVNPETSILAPEMVVGEIWIDSPSLSGGFWGLTLDTDKIFHATCYNEEGMIDMEFLRTGLLGFVYNGKVYVLGLYEDRLRQRCTEEDEERQLQLQTDDVNEPKLFLDGYRYHYTSHLVDSITRNMQSRIFDCSAFDIFINGDHLPVVVLESSLARLGVLPGPSSAFASSSTLAGASSSAGVVGSDVYNKDLVALNDLCDKVIELLFRFHKFNVYCVIVAPANSLPRITRSGRSEIGNMLCKRRFDLGALPAAFVKFGAHRAIRNLPAGQDIVGGIWSPAISRIRSESLVGFDKQYSGVDFRDVVIDDRTATPLSDFKSIIHILRWRASHQTDELAYSTIDNRAKEGKALTYKKFDQKIASVANFLKKTHRMVAGDCLILMYTHSEDFVVAVYACLLLGITAIPIAPIDSNRLHEDLPVLTKIIKDYSARAILVHGETDSIFKNKHISQQLKQLATSSRIAVPACHNTSKVKISPSMATKDFEMPVKAFSNDFPAVVWIYFTADHRYNAVQLSHQTIMGMCKIQKETCQMSSTKPILGCVRSISGLGFLHTCLMGVYLGASTLLLSPIDYANNPSTFFLTLSRYKVKDSYSTPQMLDHACNIMKPKGFSLTETKNLMVAMDGRLRTDIVKNVRFVFASTGLEATSINLGYSHILNPLITTRSYMSIEPIDLWLDPMALRQGYVSVVNPENYPNALHLHDSGMVPVSTQVAIVNPETNRLCRVGEFGEIWVFSEGNVTGIFRSKDQFMNDRMHGKIVDGNSDIDYIRTGDLGFLHTVSKSIGPAGSGQTIEMQTLFVLGSIGETFEVLGLNHFPIDIEQSVERCHKSIVPGGTAIFQAGGYSIIIVEVSLPIRGGGTLASLVPVIVNTILEEHQFVVNIVAFMSKGEFPRSRLQEKQRGKLLQLWVSKKLKLIGQYGVLAEDNNTVVESK